MQVSGSRQRLFDQSGQRRSKQSKTDKAACLQWRNRAGFSPASLFCSCLWVHMRCELARLGESSSFRCSNPYNKKTAAQNAAARICWYLFFRCGILTSCREHLQRRKPCRTCACFHLICLPATRKKVGVQESVLFETLFKMALKSFI